ncbi:MAG: hypothetical protein AB1352_01415 [Patescibacteria group bacterium]
MTPLSLPPRPCPDCGPVPIHHTPSFLTAFAIIALSPLFHYCTPLRTVLNRFTRSSLIQNFTVTLLKCCTRLGVGTIHLEPHHDLTHRAHLLWEEANKRGIHMWEFRPFKHGIELFIAERQDKRVIFNSLPRPPLRVNNLHWIDDKSIVKQVLTRSSIPTPRGYTASTLRGALNALEELVPPLVVKPRLSSRGRHAHVQIHTRAQLTQAFISARILCPWVMVEEELEGDVYRALVVDGELIAVARRNYPQVIGDGTHTIRQLVDIENTQPYRNRTIFHPIPTDSFTTRYLHICQKEWSHIPSAGETIILDRGVIRERGGLTSDVTDHVDHENARLFTRIARIINDPLIGIDFIIKDIAHPWFEQTRSGVIELNALPYIDLHHYCISGTPRNAVQAVWDMLFP